MAIAAAAPITAVVVMPDIPAAGPITAAVVTPAVAAITAAAVGISAAVEISAAVATLPPADSTQTSCLQAAAQLHRLRGCSVRGRYLQLSLKEKLNWRAPRVVPGPTANARTG